MRKWIRNWLLKDEEDYINLKEKLKDHKEYAEQEIERHTNAIKDTLKTNKKNIENQTDRDAEKLAEMFYSIINHTTRIDVGYHRDYIYREYVKDAMVRISEEYALKAIDEKITDAQSKIDEIVNKDSFIRELVIKINESQLNKG